MVELTGLAKTVQNNHVIFSARLLSCLRPLCQCQPWVGGKSCRSRTWTLSLVLKIGDKSVGSCIYVARRSFIFIGSKSYLCGARRIFKTSFKYLSQVFWLYMIWEQAPCRVHISRKYCIFKRCVYLEKVVNVSIKFYMYSMQQVLYIRKNIYMYIRTSCIHLEKVLHILRKYFCPRKGAP